MRVKLDQLNALQKRELLLKLMREKNINYGSVKGNPLKPRAIERFAIPAAELASEVQLDPSIYPEQSTRLKGAQPEAVFLTGATGFLGAFILEQLLSQTKADIYCLVRSSSLQEGRKKLTANLQQYKLDPGYSAERIKIIIGDLSLLRFGLSDPEYEMLAEKVDLIYHNGALVNWIYPYSRLRRVNVDSIPAVLRLACYKHLKPVHYTSTLSVFPLVNNELGRVILEDDSIDHGDIMLGGYTQSKWVAEKIFMLARARGIPVSIYRSGIISGHSLSGAWTTVDFLSKLIRSWIELGYAPDLEGAVDMTPVDYVSKSLVRLSLTRSESSGNYHLINPERTSWRQVYSMIRANDYQLKIIPYDRWRLKIIQQAGAQKNNSASFLVPLFSDLDSSSNQDIDGFLDGEQVGELDRIGSMVSRQYLVNGLRFDDSNATRNLNEFAIKCPSVDSEVLALGLKHFVSRGFLSTPEYYRQRNSFL